MAKHYKKEKIRLYLLIYFIIVIIISLLYTIKFFINIYQTNQESKLLINTNVDTSKITNKKTEKMLKIKKLQKQNSDIVGWLEIENTKISYPVLQGKDNKYYITHNYKKKKSSSGSLFLDKNYNWDTPSTNLLIYGHNNKNGLMFQDLLKYENKAFYENHQNIKFTTINEYSEYEIISVFKSRVYDKSEKNVFRYYFFINANNKKQYNDFVKNVKNASLYSTGKSSQYNEQLITLSTCSYHTKDGRFVVVGKKKTKL